MVDTFTEDQIRLASFRMALENNAMLRIILGNQVRIMEKLNMEMDLPESIYADLMPGAPNADAKDTIANLLRGVEPMTGLLSKRAWEWIQINGQPYFDTDPDK